MRLEEELRRCKICSRLHSSTELGFSWQYPPPQAGRLAGWLDKLGLLPGAHFKFLTHKVESRKKRLTFLVVMRFGKSNFGRRTPEARFKLTRGKKDGVMSFDQLGFLSPLLKWPTPHLTQDMRLSKGCSHIVSAGRGGGVSQKTKERGVWKPPKLTDLICEQPLRAI